MSEVVGYLLRHKKAHRKDQFYHTKGAAKSAITQIINDPAIGYS